MWQAWSKQGQEIAWIGLAFCIGLAPSYMGYTPVTLACVVSLFGYVVFRMWKER